MTAGFARAACRALCTAAVWAAVTPASAQNEQDLLRYSYLETTGGSFRYMGLGGAGVALGADLGAAGHNPAGLGVYRRGDLGMSFGVDGRLTTTTMAGPAADESRFSGSMPNIGIALTYPSIDPDWAFRPSPSPTTSAQRSLSASRSRSTRPALPCSTSSATKRRATRTPISKQRCLSPLDPLG